MTQTMIHTMTHTSKRSMKKVVLIIVLIAVAASFGFSEEVERRNSLAVNPLSAILALTMNMVDITMEYQYLFGPYVSLVVMPEIVFGPGLFGAGVGLGVNVYPFGKGFNGLFIGLVPLGGIISVYNYLFPFYGAVFRLGFQWVFGSGFLLSIAGGGDWDNYSGLGPHIAVYLGYAW